VLANHPHGFLDAALLASLLLSLREDVKFLANPLLTGIEGLRDLIIPIDPDRSDGQANGAGVRQALRFLDGGGLLVIFPAGQVSHFNGRAICDPPWRESVARMLRLACRRSADLRVIPAFVEGRNSWWFQGAGLIHPRLRTALLLRELLSRRGSTVRIRLGKRTSAESILAARTDGEAMAYLRWRTDLLATKSPFKARTNRPLTRARREARRIAPPVSPDLLASEIELLEPLAESGAMVVYAANAWRIPSVLSEIARLREVTFREAGEGTGESEDGDRFDRHYEHLFIWHREHRTIAGAYRVCSTEVGVRGLYTATLFRYDDEFLRKLGPALELGRSFIRREYQRDFAPLLLLWKGIGRMVARSPGLTTLFGAVSISSEYQPASRQIMASFLRRFAWFDEMAALVSSRRDFVPRLDSLAADVDELSAAVSDIEEKPAGVPVLLRQYLKLGGKLLGFNVDPEFANVLDGLIVVDLRRTDPKLLKRILGSNATSTVPPVG
jgi:putative hemolysin